MQWACLNCTFLNVAGSVACTMCTAPAAPVLTRIAGAVCAGAGPSPCANGCGCFGGGAFQDGLCSLCWKVFLSTLPADEQAHRKAAAEAAQRGAGPASAEEILAALRKCKPDDSEAELSESLLTYLAIGATKEQMENEVAAMDAMRAQRTAFAAALRGAGYDEIQIEGKGNCLFGAIAHQVYGNEHLHAVVRKGAVDFLRALHARDGSRAAEAMARDAPMERGVAAYLDTMEKDKTWGDTVILRACADVYGREVLVYCFDGAGAVPYPFFPGPLSRGTVPALVLSNFGQRLHFNSCVDSHTIEHRLPEEMAGVVEAAALERLGAGGVDSAGGGGPAAAAAAGEGADAAAAGAAACEDAAAAAGAGGPACGKGTGAGVGGAPRGVPASKHTPPSSQTPTGASTSEAHVRDGMIFAIQKMALGGSSREKVHIAP